MTKPLPMETRLCYFDFTGLGEPCRYMLSYGNEKFVDDRLSREQFAERKSSKQKLLHENDNFKIEL
jgi:hypothetical protein